MYVNKIIMSYFWQKDIKNESNPICQLSRPWRFPYDKEQEGDNLVKLFILKIKGGPLLPVLPC